MTKHLLTLLLFISTSVMASEDIKVDLLCKFDYEIYCVNQGTCGKGSSENIYSIKNFVVTNDTGHYPITEIDEQYIKSEIKNSQNKIHTVFVVNRVTGKFSHLIGYENETVSSMLREGKCEKIEMKQKF